MQNNSRASHRGAMLWQDHESRRRNAAGTGSHHGHRHSRAGRLILSKQETALLPARVVPAVWNIHLIVQGSRNLSILLFTCIKS
jgi:hypothetical protein